MKCAASPSDVYCVSFFFNKFLLSQFTGERGFTSTVVTFKQIFQACQHLHIYICLLEDAGDFILCKFGCTLHAPQSICVFISKHESAQLISWNIYLTACFNVRHITIFQELFIFRSLWQEIGTNNTFSLAIFPSFSLNKKKSCTRNA